MSNLAPGTYVQESNFPTFTPTVPTTSSAVFVGAHNQGPVTIQLVQSWPQFISMYGNFTGTTVPSELALAVYSFFNNGGGQCYVLRVVHSDAVAAAQYLTAPGPVNTFLVSATNPGTWGNNIYAVTTLTATGRFNLAVYVGGTAQGNLAEPIWTNLSMSPGDSRYAPSIINNPLNGSQFIVLTDEATNPLVTPGPLPIAATIQLGTGTGSTPGANGSVVLSSDLAASTAQLNMIHTPLVINFPGVTDVTNVIDPMIQYCSGQVSGRPFADSVLVVDPPPGQTPAAAISYAGSISPSSYAALYYPWVTVSDPSSNAQGALRTVAPGAFAMAVMAQTDAQSGVQQAPAGFQTNLVALAPERYLQESDLGNLNAAGVNAIRYLPGSGIVVWGARTLSNIQSTLYINVRRTLIYVEAQLKALSAFAVFADNDAFLWNQVTMQFNKFLTAFWAGGGLAGGVQASAFFITCDPTNNTAGSSTMNAQVGVAVSRPTEFIVINVGQWQGGSQIVETGTTGIGS